ncbi:MAG: acyl-[acyl-carrier-protein]--UDP-N-acetylglucosamine O-acyltransferase, partial [Verrucomicrobia bacterium]|nr:acyl-[acyl-carrier-protein]--UDP-N-acetylglucosamine O-acyltransferase [Verrucomicrobiota bacterium]
NSVGMERRGISEDAQKTIKEAYRITYRKGLSTSQALEAMKAELQTCPEAEHFVSFIRNSERGIIK